MSLSTRACKQIARQDFSYVSKHLSKIALMLASIIALMLASIFSNETLRTVA